VKTWLFRILVYRARTAGAHEPRTTQLEPDDVLEGRFGPSGAWAQPPEPWADAIDSRITADKIVRRIKDCLPLLPATQRQVFTLRDIEEVGAADVCELLGLSEGNQRVLLHRARSRVRRILEVTIGED
jgi:RNA polymerase sigma-70 factor (ECF subfamily)